MIAVEQIALVKIALVKIAMTLDSLSDAEIVT